MEKAARTPRTAPVDLPEEAVSVFEQLRAWRATAAKEQGVPAYVQTLPSRDGTDGFFIARLRRVGSA